MVINCIKLIKFIVKNTAETARQGGNKIERENGGMVWGVIK